MEKDITNLEELKERISKNSNDILNLMVKYNQLLSLFLSITSANEKINIKEYFRYDLYKQAQQLAGGVSERRKACDNNLGWFIWNPHSERMLLPTLYLDWV